MLDDFVDVTRDEKHIMHLWNSFVRKQRVLADGHIPWACEAFTQLYGPDFVRAPALLCNYRIWSFLGLVMTTYTAWYLAVAALLHGQIEGVKHSGPTKLVLYFTGATNILYTFRGHAVTVIRSNNRAVSELIQSLLVRIGKGHPQINSKGSSEQQSPNRCTTEGKKVHGNAEQIVGSLLPSERHGNEDPASDDENHDSRRSRSKLERWTGHKERGYSNIQPSSIVREVEDSQDEVNELVKDENTETNAEEQDRHLDTVAKLKMRGERFKLPMPGEKDKDLTGNKKVESDAPSSCIQNETAASTASCDVDVKLELPARKRKWTCS